MGESDKAKSDQVQCTLHDEELNAVTGGGFDPFARWGDIKGETDAVAKTPSPVPPVPLPYPVRIL